MVLTEVQPLACLAYEAAVLAVVVYQHAVVASVVVKSREEINRSQRFQSRHRDVDNDAVLWQSDIEAVAEQSAFVLLQPARVVIQMYALAGSIF